MSKRIAKLREPKDMVLNVFCWSDLTRKILSRWCRDTNHIFIGTTIADLSCCSNPVSIGSVTGCRPSALAEIRNTVNHYVPDNTNWKE